MDGKCFGWFERQGVEQKKKIVNFNHTLFPGPSITHINIFYFYMSIHSNFFLAVKCYFLSPSLYLIHKVGMLQVHNTIHIPKILDNFLFLFFFFFSSFIFDHYVHRLHSVDDGNSRIISSHKSS
jgi:hypothetical protein